jgi:hypothetical protein
MIDSRMGRHGEPGTRLAFTGRCGYPSPMRAGQRERNRSADSHASTLLMPSGSLRQFEQWLGNPDWFRDGTGLARHPAALPEVISVADDLAILANIVVHGAAPAIVRRILAPG